MILLHYVNFGFFSSILIQIDLTHVPFYEGNLDELKNHHILQSFFIILHHSYCISNIPYEIMKSNY